MVTACWPRLSRYKKPLWRWSGASHVACPINKRNVNKSIERVSLHKSCRACGRARPRRPIQFLRNIVQPRVVSPMGTAQCLWQYVHCVLLQGGLVRNRTFHGSNPQICGKPPPRTAWQRKCHECFTRLCTTAPLNIHMYKHDAPRKIIFPVVSVVTSGKAPRYDFWASDNKHGGIRRHPYIIPMVAGCLFSVLMTCATGHKKKATITTRNPKSNRAMQCLPWNLQDDSQVLFVTGGTAVLECRWRKPRGAPFPCRRCRWCELVPTAVAPLAFARCFKKQFVTMMFLNHVRPCSPCWHCTTGHKT